MTQRPGCRRRHPRHPLDESLAARVEFGYPRQQDPPCAARLRDLSESGIGFILEQELPGLEVGDSLDGAALRLGGRVVRGDLLVMHFTATPGGCLCGALFYPASDEDLLAFREILRELEARSRLHELAR